MKTKLNNLEKYLAANTVRDLSTGCLCWTGHIDKHGYGRITSAKGTRGAHVELYERQVGPIPEGLELDHTCRVRRCVEVGHLEPVTRKVNILRGESFSAVNARKTHCDNGHAFEPENTYTQDGKRRQCRECNRLAQQKRRAKMRETSA